MCHASEDRQVAEAAVVALEARGLGCWIAPRDVPPGTDYANAILAGISGSRALLLVFSHRANESPHVPREVERAVHRKMPIVPFRLDEVEPSGPLEYFISGAQWLDATSGRPEDHLPALVDAVAALLAPEGPVPGAKAFSDEARSILHDVVFRYGTDLARDPRRLQAVLRDMVGEHPAEIAALVAAAEEGVPEMLLQASDPGASATMERLARRLRERKALGAEASSWAVASWAKALRLPPSVTAPEPAEPVSDDEGAKTRPVAAGSSQQYTAPTSESPRAPARSEEAAPKGSEPAPATGEEGPALPSGSQTLPDTPPAPEKREEAGPAASASSLLRVPGSTQRPARTPPRPEQPPRRRRRGWVYLVVALLGVGLAVGAVAVLRGDSGDDDSAERFDGRATTTTAAAARDLSSDSQQILSQGLVRIGRPSVENPPFTPFEADLAQEIVRRLFGDIVVESVPLTVAERFDALANGDIDFLIRNTTHTTSREELALFTSPYFLEGLAFALPTDLGFESIDGLSGRTVGVYAGTSLEQDVRDGLEENGVAATVVGFDGFDALLDGLATGQVDAVGVFWTLALGYAEDPGVDAFLFSPQEPLSIATPLGHAGLRDDLDRILSEVMVDGTWRELYELHFNEPPPWDESFVLGFPPVDR